MHISIERVANGWIVTSIGTATCVFNRTADMVEHIRKLTAEFAIDEPVSADTDQFVFEGMGDE